MREDPVFLPSRSGSLSSAARIWIFTIDHWAVNRLQTHISGSPPNSGSSASTPSPASRARWFQLRAATSLARLRRDQGNRAAARDLLASIYGWFPEGFDTRDLLDAKALLEEL